MSKLKVCTLNSDFEIIPSDGPHSRVFTLNTKSDTDDNTTKQLTYIHRYFFIYFLAFGDLETVIFVEKSTSIFCQLYTFSIHSIGEIVKSLNENSYFFICGIKQLSFATVLAQGYDNKTDGKL